MEEEEEDELEEEEDENEINKKIIKKTILNKIFALFLVEIGLKLSTSAYKEVNRLIKINLDVCICCFVCKSFE